MNGLLKIDSIMYRVNDLARSASFYEQVLGLKRVWTDEAMGMIGFVFPKSDSEIVIHTDTSLPNPDYSFLVDDVAQLCDDFRRQGHNIQFRPIDVRCGKYAILSDPDGNRIPIIDLTKFGGKPRYDA
jgi:predicted enzyme related to lactoylglutathione lyase